MKLIIAIIKPFKLDDLHDALAGVVVAGMTVSVAVPAERAAAVIETIMSAARAGQIGDGKIFVVHIERAYRIRTGESDRAAL